MRTDLLFQIGHDSFSELLRWAWSECGIILCVLNSFEKSFGCHPGTIFHPLQIAMTSIDTLDIVQCQVLDNSCYTTRRLLCYHEKTNETQKHVLLCLTLDFPVLKFGHDTHTQSTKLARISYSFRHQLIYKMAVIKHVESFQMKLNPELCENVKWNRGHIHLPWQRFTWS